MLQLLKFTFNQLLTLFANLTTIVYLQCFHPYCLRLDTVGMLTGRFEGQTDSRTLGLSVLGRSKVLELIKTIQNNSSVLRKHFKLIINIFFSETLLHNICTSRPPPSNPPIQSHLVQDFYSLQLSCMPSLVLQLSFISHHQIIAAEVALILISVSAFRSSFYFHIKFLQVQLCWLVALQLQLQQQQQQQQLHPWILSWRLRYTGILGFSFEEQQFDLWFELLNFYILFGLKDKERSKEFIIGILRLGCMFVDKKSFHLVSVFQRF